MYGTMDEKKEKLAKNEDMMSRFFSCHNLF